jgi:hypothetical protein
MRFLLMFLITRSNLLMAQIQTPEQVVQTNLNCYNNRDIEGFMSSFHHDIKIYSLGESIPTVVGTLQVRKLYKELFDLSPKLHSTILKRIVFDNKVIDHESIVGRRGSADIYELVLIYEVRDEKIFSITVIRK